MNTITVDYMNFHAALADAKACLSYVDFILISNNTEIPPVMQFVFTNTLDVNATIFALKWATA